MFDDALLEAASAFHGHLGPWLALGLRAGRRAARVLGAGSFRLRAAVRCPARTPYSCFLDGIQFGSGCTLGKGNIRHIAGPRVRVEFTRIAGRRRSMHGSPGRVEARLRLELRPEVWTELLLEPARDAGRVAALGRSVWRRPFRRLFFETRER